jgi:hypothetical protein
MTRATLAQQREEIQQLKDRIAAALAVCDREDRFDQGSGHWISTSEIRAALTGVDRK